MYLDNIGGLLYVSTISEQNKLIFHDGNKYATEY